MKLEKHVVISRPWSVKVLEMNAIYSQEHRLLQNAASAGQDDLEYSHCVRTAVSKASARDKVCSFPVMGDKHATAPEETSR